MITACQPAGFVFSQVNIHSNKRDMFEKLLPESHHATETLGRSVFKTISYRVVILILDFISIYLFTGQLKVAFGFMVVSNIYTTLAYFFHERIWDKIKWGKIIYKKTNQLYDSNKKATAKLPLPFYF